MSMQATRWAKAQRPKTATQRAVLMALADYANEDCLAWPSQKTLADEMLLSDRTIRTALAGLEAQDLIVRITKRNPDGTRGVDRVQLCVTQELREAALARVHRKNRPLGEPPEDFAKTTGKSRQNHRKLAAQPPEAVSGQEPSLEKPPVGIPHKTNVSDANASGGDAAVPVELSEVDLCWMDGKTNLMLCGMTAKDAGALIGALLKQGKSHEAVRLATAAAVKAGTGDPIRYMQAVLRDTETNTRAPGKGRRSGMVAIALEEFGRLH